MDIVSRAKNICLTPTTEWPVIAAETTPPATLITEYVVPLAAIGAVAGFVGGSIIGVGLGFLGGSVRTPIVVGLTLAVVSFVMAIVGCFIVAFIVNALAPSFGGEKNFIRSLQLVAYSFTAAWVAGIFHLLPVVGSLLALAAAIYSLYTFYLGAPILKRCSQEKAVAYTIVVVLCAIVLGSVLSYVVFSVFMGGAMMGTMGAGMMH